MLKRDYLKDTRNSSILTTHLYFTDSNTRHAKLRLSIFKKSK